MIERTEVQGAMATVSYLNDRFEPVSKAQATQIKVVWDNGRIAFATKTEPA